ncbi:thioester dehydrase [Shewanella hafniensis]|uniref:ApeI family dehydratase n=1 Tax=Shewanella hafniensis TaxID=365590 RepID=UPI001BB8F284|nr:thioester dehydrase [Shewanella hafniensis]MCL1134836.1 thioester dehydrase [Shewanella hafniensis]GIU31505.1 thioester dehydrase [Shewanella hafniensis]
MIKSSLPPILHSDIGIDNIELRLLVAADLDYFKGHFPEQAVLPGVTQLDWAVRLGCQYFGYSEAVANLEVLKFQQLILPGQEVTLSISNNAAKAKLTFAYSDGDNRYASGRIAFDTSPLVNQSSDVNNNGASQC